MGKERRREETFLRLGSGGGMKVLIVIHWKS